MTKKKKKNKIWIETVCLFCFQRNSHENDKMQIETDSEQNFIKWMFIYVDTEQK